MRRMTQKEWEEFLDRDVESWYANKRARNRQEKLARETRERRFVFAEKAMKKAQRGLRSARTRLGDAYGYARWAPHVYSRRAAAQVAARKARVLNWWDRVRGKPGTIRSLNYVPTQSNSRVTELVFRDGRWVNVLSLHPSWPRNRPPSSRSTASTQNRPRVPSSRSTASNRPPLSRTPSPPQNRPRVPSSRSTASSSRSRR